MQNLLWKFYLYVSVARAYFVESFKALLRRHYRDPNFHAKFGGACVVAPLAVSLLLSWLAPFFVTYMVVLLLVTPYFSVVAMAAHWDHRKDYSKAARRCTERLKAWSQEP